MGGAAALIIDTSVTGVRLDVAVGGTGLAAEKVVTGDIQGFGSVIANGIRANTDGAEFNIDGQTGTQSDLRQGQQVLMLTAADNTASQVLYRANIKGPVTAYTLTNAALGRSQMTVLGQSVTTDATTTFANFNLTTFDPLATPSELEVSGTLDNSGQLRATYVELKTGLTDYKVTGEVSSATATTLAIGSLNVDFASATLRNFDGAAVSNGDIVEVSGASSDFTAPDQLTAEEIEKLPLLRLGSSADAEVEGFIDSFTDTSEFTVQTTLVTSDANTTFINGSSASLALGVKVQVRGNVDANGVIVADQITVQATNTLRAEGNISNIVDDTIEILGVSFEVRSLTRFEDDSEADLEPFTFDQLLVADEIEIRGYQDGGTVVATQVEREDEEQKAELRGVVTALDSSAGTLEISGVAINTDTSLTQFEDDDDTPISSADFFNSLQIGDFVEATWDLFSDTANVVDELSLEDD